MPPAPPTKPATQATIGRGLLWLMATAASASTATIFYNQPLLPNINASFGLAEGRIGFIPAASQLGYSAAILLISPLGDVMDRRALIRNLSGLLTLALIVACLAPNFITLVFACFVMGLGSNITQQLIPFAASLSTQESRGKVVATLMTGVTVGILLSRTISGSMAEYFGWRSVFLSAAIIAAVMGILLKVYLPASTPTAQMRYPQLIGSMFSLFKQHRSLRDSAITGALWFAAFNAMWATLAIHVMDAPMSYTVQQAGLFGLVGLAGIFGAKLSGRFVHTLGSRKLITSGLVLVLFAFAVLVLWGNTLTGLIVGIVFVDLGVFGAQIANQVRVLSIDPAAQSRMNAVYMLCYFLGAALGSALGVQVMSLAGWQGMALFGSALIVAALVQHLLSRKHHGRS
ncbi:MFS transporter [Coraliomargarita sp. SDUM461003]|uniref:MFS transporter n=1 Tax=Thalassobacterium maritimum TaxID=3041265 RepID=A0ABU1ATH5_9BACT|nr:MFS transporter [Coraliomargarita sp. SDUM461003]MDQ8207363.1 MFS transporter [Coraliomargarita sp. SDUM461003]